MSTFKRSQRRMYRSFALAALFAMAGCSTKSTTDAAPLGGTNIVDASVDSETDSSVAVGPDSGTDAAAALDAGTDAAAALESGTDASAALDAGTDASTSVDGGEIIGEWDPVDNIGPYFLQIDRLRKGESADLNLDGIDDLIQSKDASGRTILTKDANGDGNPEYLSIYDPATGQVDVSWDNDSNGFAEWKETRTKTGKVTEKDTNGDGTYDWRQTEEYDFVAKRIKATIATDTGSGYTTLGTFSTPMRKAACGQRTPGTGTPPGNEPPPTCSTTDPPPKGRYCVKNGKSICISNNGTANDGFDPHNPMASNGSCSKPHADRLAKAISCAVDRARGCLANTNDAFAQKMAETLFTGSLNVFCGTTQNPAQDKPCNEQGSNTNSATTDRGGWSGDMSLNGANMDGLASDDELCSVMLHEMLHWADLPDDGDIHNDGVDKVYACGRYCGGSKGCQETARNTPPGCGVSGSWDCARCAGSAQEKAKCGYKTKLSNNTDAPWGICHGGLACILGTCDSAKTDDRFTCDGELTSSTFLCCATCTSGCTDSNDFPCGAAPPPVDKCSTPECIMSATRP